MGRRAVLAAAVHAVQSRQILAGLNGVAGTQKNLLHGVI